MARCGAPPIVHPWLGALHWHEQSELLGSIDIDPAIRPPRSNFSRDAEVLLEVVASGPGSSLQSHVEDCAARIKRVLTDLPLIQRYAVEHAPREWADHNEPQAGGSLIDRLFLD